MENNDFITRELHNEFAKRVEEENNRQNHRIAQLEQGLMRITEITTAIERLAVNMENMANEQGRQSNILAEQGTRLTELEGADGKKWKQVVTTIISSVVSLGFGFLAAKLGMK